MTIDHPTKFQIDRRSALGYGALTAGLALIHPARRAFGATQPIVETETGKIQGYRDGTVSIFKGIPYGAPTGGENRFMPPKKPDPWTGVRDATKLGLRCPQTEAGGLPEDVVDADTGPMGEDCLCLNVWTASLGGSHKRPVMVWLHGGGFASGSGGSVRYDGSNLAAKHDVVLVTINHRLNVFGFLYLGAVGGPPFADSGNVGMLDCVAALEWVRDNIAKFGGDPGKVTIFGQSGGAGKATTLMAMPPAKGLFHRAIAQSGLDVRRGTRDDAAKSAEIVLAQLGIKPTDLGALQVVPYEKLLAAGRALKPPVRPVVDGRSLPETPFDPRAPSVSAGVPLMIGSLLTETTYQADTPLDPIDDATLHQKLKQFARLGDSETDTLIAAYRAGRPTADNTLLYQLISTDLNYTHSVSVKAALKSALGQAPAYVYHFEKPTPVRGGKLRVPHTLDIAYAFDNIDLSQAITGPAADCRVLANTMSRAWSAFAHTGDPNVSSLPHWPAYSADQRSVMILADTCAVVNDPHSQERLAIDAVKA